MSRLFADGMTSVVTASAGNHGQGVAWISGQLGCIAEVFVPIGTPPSKLEGLDRLGAIVYEVGNNFDESTYFAKMYAKNRSTHFVHPFDDLDVMEGQGTIGDELYSQMNNNNIYAEDSVVFVPVGGGGLIGGISDRLKELTNGRIKIIGVQVEGSDSAALSFYNSLNCRNYKIGGGYRFFKENQNNKPLNYMRHAATHPNFNVDGTCVSMVGDNCMAKIITNVDEFFVISSKSLGSFYLQNPYTNLEPAGALAHVAAEMYANLDTTYRQNLIYINSGRNKDLARINNLISAVD